MLDGVQNLVVLKCVALAGYLHVGAGKLTTGAVVVHHQVVCAQDLRIGHDLVADCLNELGVGRLSQQRADGVAHQAHAADANEDAHAQARPAVEVKPVACEISAAAKTEPEVMTSFLESCAVAMSVSESMRLPSVRLNAAIQSLTSMDVASAAREINV